MAQVLMQARQLSLVTGVGGGSGSSGSGGAGKGGKVAAVSTPATTATTATTATRKVKTKPPARLGVVPPARNPAVKNPPFIGAMSDSIPSEDIPQQLLDLVQIK